MTSIKKVVLLASLLLVGNAHGETLWCEGQVSDVYVGTTSGVYINPSWGGWKYLCSLDGSNTSVSAEACEAWFTMAEMAVAGQLTLVAKLENVTGDCGTQPDNGQFPTPSYLRIKQ